MSAHPTKTHTNDSSSKGAPAADNQILTATLQTCFGCQLKKYPPVKEFIDLDANSFNNLTVESKPKQSPLVLFQDKAGQLIETVPLAGKSRSACNKLFLSKGFTKKVHQTSVAAPAKS